MDIGLRFYQKHDLDIVELKQNPSFSFTYWFKEAIRASMNGDDEFSIPLPPPSTTKNINELRSCMYHLILDEKQEGDLIDYVLNFTSGYRNAVLKNIFRSYLELPNVIPYYSITKDITPVTKKVKDRVKTPRPTPPKEITQPVAPPQKPETQADSQTTIEPVKEERPTAPSKKPQTESANAPAPAKKEPPTSENFDVFSAINKLT